MSKVRANIRMLIASFIAVSLLAVATNGVASQDEGSGGFDVEVGQPISRGS